MADSDPARPIPVRPETIDAIRFFETQAAAGTTHDMSDTRTPLRTEPTLDVEPGPAAEAREPVRLGEPVIVRPREPETVVLRAHEPRDEEPVTLAPAAPPPQGDRRGSSEQLARLEDKAARIEEKLARSESNTQRVVDRFELASARMGEVALQTDLAAVKGEVSVIARRVRNLPGFTALVFTAIITAVLTSVLTAVIFRYLLGIVAR